MVEDIFPILKNLDLSDISRDDRDIDLLIGADYYWCVVEGETKRCGTEGLVAINSKLGWLLSGPYEWNNQGSAAVNLATTHVLSIEFNEEQEEALLSSEIEKFWNLDTVGIKHNETSVYEKFMDEVKFKEGRYEVRLPFKEDHPLIEDQYASTLTRLKRLKIKLDVNKNLLEQYDMVMKKQLKLGIIEEVHTEPIVGKVTYLPHRAVIREDKMMKVRIVFDASAKYKGPSLNDCLYKGPSLNPLLFDILLRFRVHPIGLSADIEAAYLQISVPEEDRDYMRFLWYDDVSKTNPQIVKYRFTRIIFGATSSQFLLNGVLKIHADRYRRDDPEFSNILNRHLFIDDLNCSVPSVGEGVNLYRKVKTRFLEANFNFRRWRTNDRKLQRFIQFQENKSIVKPEGNDCHKVLGIPWNNEDEFVIDASSYVKEVDILLPTKRNILRLVAGIYDPLGFIQSLTIKLKLLMQEICATSLGWDEKLDKSLAQKCLKVVEEFRQMQYILIPRCYCHNEVNDPIKVIELHGFSDASALAFGACIYLKFIKVSGNRKVVFVTSKSRIAPSKSKHTIPRLELLGNFILSRLVVSVSGALQQEMKIDEIFCWSDSKVSLAWIKSKTKEFKTFVQNRVIEIRKNVHEDNWHHCSSDENPADIITRGNNDPNSSLWWNGPTFLTYDDYPSTKIELDFSDDTPDYIDEIPVSKLALHASMIPEKSIGKVINIERYNDLLKLFRITAYVIRFIANLKAKANKKKLCLHKYVISSELREAKFLWIKDNQIDMNTEHSIDLKLNLNLND